MFNKNKVNLTFYTNESSIFINEKPTFKQSQPEWSKLLKNTFKTFDQKTNSHFEIPTIKNCPGINYYLNEGIKFRMWTDLKLRVHPSGFVEYLPLCYEHKSPVFSQHSEKQYEYLYPQNKTAFKLNNPWIAECNRDLKFLFVESHYSTNFFREHNMYIAPGVIDFKYQSALNVHIVVDKKEEPYEILMPYQTPLFTLYPLTEKKVNINYEMISIEEFIDKSNKFPKCPVRKYYQFIKNMTH